jgi:RHS repeat-associated protein
VIARRAAAALFAAALAGAAPALAQDAPDGISPLRVESDHNGVNIVSGKMAMQGPTLSVPAAPNLVFDRIQNARPSVKGSSSGPGGGEGNSTASVSVHTGSATSESFKCDGFECESVTGTGSVFQLYGRQTTPTIIGHYMQAGTGAAWSFARPAQDTLSATQRKFTYYAASVSYPNGETISYNYATSTSNGFVHHRPIRLSSNLGYHIEIAYQYAGDDVSNPFWGAPSVVALYRTGDPAPLGRLTYSGATVTDLEGREYGCTGCSNALGAEIEVTGGALTLPGEGPAALAVAAHPDAPLVASVVRDGVAWTYSYANPRFDAATVGWRYDGVTVDGPGGFRQVYEIGGLGPLGRERNVIAASTDSIGRTTRYQHDFAYRVTRIVLPELNEIAVAYDKWGNIVGKTTIPKPGSGLAAVTETAFYPTDSCLAATATVLCYRPAWTEDGLGRRTDYVWNAAGQLLEQTDPPDQNGFRKKTIISYETSAGLSRRSVVRQCLLGSTCGTSLEIRTEYSYWGNTFLPSRERRLDSYYGRTRDTNFTYDAAGRLLSKDGPLPETDDAVYTRWDRLGRKTWEIGARSAEGLRIATRFAYRNADDKVAYSETGTLPDAQSEALAVFSRSDFSYDAQRNPDRMAVSKAGTTHKVTDRSWDARGRLVCSAVRMNPAAFGQKPGACAHTGAGAQGPDRITWNHYDAAGQLIRVEKAVGTPIRQDYAQFEYSPNGRRLAVTDANGNRAEMIWDGFDRQKRWIFPSNTPGVANQADYEEYGYDPVGNRTKLRKRDGSELTYQHDNLDRVIRKTVPERSGLTAAQTRDVYYDYNHALGLQTKARFDNLDGYGVTNYYDAFGQPTTVLLNMDGAYRYTSYSYDDAGNLARLTHPDGAAFAYGYDALGRMTQVSEHRVVPSLDDLIVRYWYNAAGSRHSAVRGAGTGGFYTIFYRDPLERPSVVANDLPAAGNDMVIELAYNPAGQIASRSVSNDAYAAPPEENRSLAYQVNGLNQYIAASNRTYGYDPNGNLAGDGTTSYVYDVENRLVSASGQTSATLVYDPLGRLVQVTNAAGAQTRFLYDGDKLIAEYDGSGTLLRRYVHGPGADEPVAVYEGPGPGLGLANRRYMLPDERGSIAALVNADGVPTVINRYDAWGVPGANNAGRFQYTGQAWIPELGLYYYKARIYSPMLGRFLQTDPVGYKDQMNLYAYAGNDPVNGKDPTGKTCTSSQVEGKMVYSCRIDGIAITDKNGRVTGVRPPNADETKRFAAFNARYTATVNRLMEKPDRGATVAPIKGKAGSFETTAGAAAASLISRQFLYAPGGDKSSDLETSGGFGVTLKGDATTYVHPGGLSSAGPAGIVHDGGMHGTFQEWTGGLLNPDLPLRDFEHQKQYNDAACELLGGQNC